MTFLQPTNYGTVACEASAQTQFFCIEVRRSRTEKAQSNEAARSVFRDFVLVHLSDGDPISACRRAIEYAAYVLGPVDLVARVISP